VGVTRVLAPEFAGLVGRNSSSFSSTRSTA
jgi:hypothetical protein